ncbi:MAG: glycosyltransferase family 1 protein, partial [Planctomycetaceae bacterium]
DRSWGQDFPWNEVRRAQSRGALVGVVVYDLIPIEHPEFIEAGLRIPFRDWWNRVERTADFLVTISRSVVDDIARIQRGRPKVERQNRPLPMRAFTLGAKLDGTTADQAIRPELLTLMDSAVPGGVYLMVGTVTSRKGHALALEACERIWAAGGDARLVIAGKNGCAGDALVDRIRQHPRLGERVFWFDDLNDAELSWCFRQASALITASQAEGFNLPIVEALSHGCPVFASDLPVHREVGGEFATYFPAGDPAALARLITDHPRQPRRQSQTSLPGFRWPDWNESCESLLKAVLELAQQVKPECSPQADLRAQATPAPVRPRSAA